MGVETNLEILVVSDTHREFLPIDPRITIDKIVSESNADFFINLGDNSGNYAMSVRKIAENNNFPYVSVLGNHDVKVMEIDSLNVPRNNFFKNFFSQEITRTEKKELKRTGYGTFEKSDKYFKPLFDFRTYFIKVKTDEGHTGLLLRHFPYYFEKDPSQREIRELICTNNLDSLYVVSGHWHRENLLIEGRQKGMNIGTKQIPVFAVVLPPFTKGPEDKIHSSRCMTKYYAGLYNLSILDDGSLSMKENYVRNSVVKTKSFEPITSIENISREIITGDLIVC